MTVSFQGVQDTTCLAVCADQGIFDLLVGLLLSLRDLDRNRYKIGVIDTGLTSAQREHISALCDTIEPIDPSRLVVLNPQLEARIIGQSPYWRSQACRPYLRDYFPGHRYYIHLDADMWVQRPGFFDDAVAIMDKGQVIIVPEADVAYPHNTTLADNLSYFGAKSYVVRQSLGEPVAQETAALPFLNTGFFGMRHDLPHWELFTDQLKRMFQHGYHHLTEQLAFNVVLLQHKGFTALPAQCNWMCSWTPPVRDEHGLWRSPVYPYTPIDILHLTGTDKRARYARLGLLYDGGRYLDGIAHLLPST
ncbi:hypothetical protein [Azospirillum agricola]|uniref:hypothetical protein n=1 Tax=Azospirillum agricola TaxID=1720247 RepID=UPI000A0F1C80|nr:hypothetical protein [Azospirillum agricola]SMH41340.1 Lipopolysaccharide biosynthesis protein, LPS:glycosyltransferase [Azospirillum lipoferum]